MERIAGRFLVFSWSLPVWFQISVPRSVFVLSVHSNLPKSFLPWNSLEGPYPQYPQVVLSFSTINVLYWCHWSLHLLIGTCSSVSVDACVRSRIPSVCACFVIAFSNFAHGTTFNSPMNWQTYTVLLSVSCTIEKNRFVKRISPVTLEFVVAEWPVVIYVRRYLKNMTSCLFKFLQSAWWNIS